MKQKTGNEKPQFAESTNSLLDNTEQDNTNQQCEAAKDKKLHEKEITEPKRCDGNGENEAIQSSQTPN